MTLRFIAPTYDVASLRIFSSVTYKIYSYFVTKIRNILGTVLLIHPLQTEILQITKILFRALQFHLNFTVCDSRTFTVYSLVHMSRCTSRCVPAFCRRRTGANRDEPKGIRMRLYIPSSATDLGTVSLSFP